MNRVGYRLKEYIWVNFKDFLKSMNTILVKTKFNVGDTFYSWKTGYPAKWKVDAIRINTTVGAEGDVYNDIEYEGSYVIKNPGNDSYCAHDLIHEDFALTLEEFKQKFQDAIKDE